MNAESLSVGLFPAPGKLNPFQIPEILFVLGQYLPLWKKPHGYAREFDPTVFLACLQVCKLWRYTLITHLWHVYEESTMFWIPLEVLIKNLKYFRFADNWGIVTITAGSRNGPKNGSGTNGQEAQATTRSEQRDVALRKNADLRHWTLKGADSDRDTPMSTWTVETVASHESLRSLELMYWTLEISAIENLLFRNKRRLKTFTLNQCRYREAPLAALGHGEDPMSGFLTLAQVPTACPDLQKIILKPDRTPVQQAKGNPPSELDTYGWAARLILGLTYTEGQQVKLRCGIEAMRKIRAGMIKLKPLERPFDSLNFERSDTGVEDKIEVVLRW
ncbi:hypothetical protein BG011_003133 [Mortierella polycephala]|uniref:F-box domain-containing protein n=1 Tax=Mortierella polycephala TaxID=41804 RepID=A0A9P6U993_9FUNG|nr:hypothetical protein BG011_003133 [Mortierella polycephala]